MKKYYLWILLILTSVSSYSQRQAVAGQVQSNDGGYGYMLVNNSTCSVWWAEGAYKVMRNTALPVRSEAEVKLQSAKNEFESFIIVVRPTVRMEKFRITLSELADESGNRIGTENITVRKSEYVKVSKPTDSYGFVGWWPDPLPLYDKPEDLIPSENQPFWITVKVPEGTPAGDYSGNAVLSSGEWIQEIPLKLKVWDFALPGTPSIRSGFGMGMGEIKKYQNIKDKVDELKVFESYMESFRDYKISPYDPFLYSPIKEEITGVPWKGGFFDSKEKYEGTYSYKLIDNSATDNLEGTTRDLIPVKSGEKYNLCWFSRSEVDKQSYVTGVECYNAEKELLVFENRFEVFSGHDNWTPDTLELGQFNYEVRFIKIRLFPSNRTRTGEDKGMMWFDNLKFINAVTGQNEFIPGDFEVNPDEIDIVLDFTDFNKAGKRYFDEFGFTGYRLNLKGLGSGTFYSRQNGYFEGFEQGTEEYNKLMERYLVQMQENLEKNGWLGKEYVYWFDEPAEIDYPFVRETNALIKKYAPKITTFLTEHITGQDISDVTDISCTIWHKLNHDKIRNMNEKGQENWSYLCCWPKSPWLSEFIDHDAVNLRMWLWGSYKHNLKGILVWETTYWNSDAASPEGYLQNPWEEAMSYVTGYGWPLGKQTIWGNGDGRFFYPPNRDPNNDKKTYVGGPVPSIRLELLRDGIEDYEYFKLLEKEVKNAPKKKAKIAAEAAKLLLIPGNIYTDEKTYSKDPQDMLNYRKKIAEYIIMIRNK